MIYSAINATIRRSAGTRILTSGLSGSKGKLAYTFSQGALLAFVDDFNRTDNPSTLVGFGSRNWVNTRGSWEILSSKASTTTAASSYPLASVRTGSLNAITKVGYGVAAKHGWGVAFWLSDSANWYAAVTDRTYVQTNYQQTVYNCYGAGSLCNDGRCMTYPYPCAQNGGSGIWQAGNGTCCDGNCPNPCPYYSPVGSTSGYPYGANPSNPGSCNCTCICSGPEGQSYDAGVSYQTVYVDHYVYQLNTIKSTAGTVSTLDNFTYIGDTPTSTSYLNYVQVSTDTPVSGTVRLTYQLNNGSTLTRDVVVTSPAKAKSYGIIISPVNNTSSAAQAVNVDDFDYTPLV